MLKKDLTPAYFVELENGELMKIERVNGKMFLRNEFDIISFDDYDEDMNNLKNSEWSVLKVRDTKDVYAKLKTIPPVWERSSVPRMNDIKVFDIITFKDGKRALVNDFWGELAMGNMKGYFTDKNPASPVTEYGIVKIQRPENPTQLDDWDTVPVLWSYKSSGMTEEEIIELCKLVEAFGLL